MPRKRVLERARAVPVVLEAELYEKAVELAKARGLSFSGLVRNLLKKELEAEPFPEEWKAEAQPPPPEPPLPPAPKRTRWGFCPDCLAIYAFEVYDKCPKCGSKLVPMDTEEGKNLYQELKRKKAEEGGGS